MVRDNVLGNTMQPEDISNKEVCSFSGGGELGQGHKMNSFREVLYYGKDDGVTL